MFRCGSCNFEVQPDRKGHYTCDACEHQGFFLVNPIPEGNDQSLEEDESPQVMVTFIPVANQSEVEFIRIVLNFVTSLKNRGLSQIRKELSDEGRLSVGPMFPNEAEGIKILALEKGIQANVHRS